LDIIKKGDRGRRRPYLARVKAVVHLGVKSGIFISSFYKLCGKDILHAVKPVRFYPALENPVFYLVI
jgi:hypothetical protein